MQTVEYALQMVFHSIAAVHLDSLDNLAKVGCGLYKLDINCNSFQNVISQVVTQRHICFECLYVKCTLLLFLTFILSYRRNF